MNSMIRKLAEDFVVWDLEPDSEEGQMQQGEWDIFDQPWDEMYEYLEPSRTSSGDVPVDTTVHTDEGKLLFESPWSEMKELRKDEIEGHPRDYINVEHLNRDSRHKDLQDLAGGVPSEMNSVPPPSATTTDYGGDDSKLASLSLRLEHLARALRG